MISENQNLFQIQPEGLLYNQYRLLLPCPTGKKKQYHAKIQQLKIRHKCNHQCEIFLEFRSINLILEHKKFIQFDNMDNNVANKFYSKLKIKNQSSFNLCQQKIRKQGFQNQHDRRLQQKLVIDIVLNMHKNGYLKQIISNTVKRPLSRVNYIIKNQEQAEISQNNFIWMPQHSIWMNNILTNQTNIKYCFNNHFQCCLKYQVFSQLAKNNMRISFRFPTCIKIQSQTLNIKELRYQFSIRLANYITQGFEIIYLDETYIGRNIKKSKMWQSKDRSINIQDFQPDFPLSILGAISTKGFLAYQLVAGSVNGIIYANHIQQIIQQIKLEGEITNFLFILDNAAIHKAQGSSKQVLNQVEYLYLPPYTPQFNPIELLWGLIKKELYKQLCFKDRKQLIKILHEIFTTYNFNDIRNICQQSQKKLKSGYLKEQF